MTVNPFEKIPTPLNVHYRQVQPEKPSNGLMKPALMRTVTAKGDQALPLLQMVNSFRLTSLGNEKHLRLQPT